MYIMLIIVYNDDNDNNDSNHNNANNDAKRSATQGARDKRGLSDGRWHEQLCSVL